MSAGLTDAAAGPPATTPSGATGSWSTGSRVPAESSGGRHVLGSTAAEALPVRPDRGPGAVADADLAMAVRSRSPAR